MRLIAGVDGGQSSTVAAILDLDDTNVSHELARGIGPPADLVGEARGSTRRARAITAAIHGALAAAGLDLATPLVAIVAGLSGFEDGDAPPALPFPGAAVRAVHDGVTAHAGALDGGPGIVVIAGTGSVVLGTDAAGGRARAGGWGYLFGDAGSGFAIGRDAIALAMRDADRGVASPLQTLVLDHFGVRDLRAVQADFASGAIARSAIAAIAENVLALSERGDADARDLVRAALRALAAEVRVVNGRLAREERRSVSYVGGLFRSTEFANGFAALIESADPETGAAGTPLVVHRPSGDGVSGALALAEAIAGRSAGRPRPAIGVPLAAVLPVTPPPAIVRPAAPLAAHPRLAALRGGLIVSVQAEAESPLNAPAAIALLAAIAETNGAAGVRIEGAARIAAVRDRVAVPIVGIVKRKHAGFEPYITTSCAEASEAIDAGASIVAFDATLRPRASGDRVADLVAHIHARGALAMADCAEFAEAEAAAGAGADIVATTLAGYTAATAGTPLPALGLVRALAALHPFAICEGGIASAAEAGEAFAAGAEAVVVGTAITNVDVLVRRFVAVTPRARRTGDSAI